MIIFFDRILIIRWLVFALCITFILPRLSYAEEGSFCLGNYIKLALENNSELKSAFYDWQSSLFEIHASDSLPDPKIGYGYYVRSVETRVGPQKNRISASQTIPWLGKLRNRRSFAYKKSILAEQKLNIHTHALVRRLKDAFYEHYFLDQSYNITEENIALVNILEGVAQRRVQVGASSADAIQAQIVINQLHDNVDGFDKKRQGLYAKIIALINIPESLTFHIPRDLLEIPQTINHLLTIELIRDKNPLMLYLCNKTEREKVNYKLTVQDRFPDITLGVDWIDTGRAIAPTRDSGKDALIASVSINIPIWTHTYRSRENAAKSQIVSALELYNQKEREIFAEYEDIVLKYDDAHRRALLFRDTLLPQAKHALEILIESYQSGKSTFDRVLESQRELLRIELDYQRAIVDRAKAVSAYEEIIGAYSL